jgi:maltooligosyltrehalose trehalohydrolase
MTGTSPTVWAPFADRVELVVDDSRHPMERRDGGWWASTRSLPAGTEYAFALDGGEPLPDPRSPWQPSGVHGRSRTVDHSTFAWTDGGWRPPPLREAIVEETHVGIFSAEGTFDGVIGHLDHLVELGVTHLELMPVAEFAGTRGWGYDGVDLYAPHSAYGGPDGLKRLVDAAHGRGLAVLLDVVYNHLGPEGNYLGRFGPYFTDRYGTPWGAAVNFDDRGSHEVRRFVVDNAVMWLRDYHIDGLRLDAVHAIYDMSAVHILEEMATEVRRLEGEVGRPFAVTAESDLNDPRIVRAPEAGGYALDAAWSDDVHHALHAALTGERGGYYVDFGDPAILPRALRDPFVYADAYSAHRDRRHGRSAGDLPGDRFVACLQNHDQVGNRARGDRIGHLVSEGRARIGAALLMVSPYVPLLFAGEEWNASSPFPFFASHTDPELARAVSEGRRREFAAFGWDPADIPDPMDPRTFERARLDWAERGDESHAGILAWYRTLISLRRSTPELTDADRTAVDVAGSADARLTVRRGPITVVANLGAEPVPADATGRVVLAWPSDATPEAPLPPDGVLVLDAR